MKVFRFLTFCLPGFALGNVAFWGRHAFLRALKCSVFPLATEFGWFGETLPSLFLHSNPLLFRPHPPIPSLDPTMFCVGAVARGPPPSPLTHFTPTSSSTPEHSMLLEPAHPPLRPRSTHTQYSPSAFPHPRVSSLARVRWGTAFFHLRESKYMMSLLQHIGNSSFALIKASPIVFN